MYANVGQTPAQMLAQAICEHEVQDVMQQFRQVRSNGRRKHANVHWKTVLLQERSIFFERKREESMFIGSYAYIGTDVPLSEGVFDVCCYGIEEGLHVAPHDLNDVADTKAGVIHDIIRWTVNTAVSWCDTYPGHIQHLPASIIGSGILVQETLCDCLGVVSGESGSD
jgi:hypothetical protein